VSKTQGDLLFALQNPSKRVIPAKAGIQRVCYNDGIVPWIPAFAGMTPLLHFFTDSEKKQ